MAETYHIYDIYGMPARQVARFAVGLRADSRTIMKLTGTNVPVNTLLLAGIVDRLSILMWSMTPDAQGMNRPVLITEKLLQTEDEAGATEVFRTAEDFAEEWKRRTEVK